MTPDEKAELRKAAEAATPGPWLDWRPQHVKWDDPMACGYDCKPGRGIYYCTGPDCESDEQAECDGLFIAAANPATVLALLDENARLAAEVERLTARLHQHEGHYDAQGLLK